MKSLTYLVALCLLSLVVVVKAEEPKAVEEVHEAHGHEEHPKDLPSHDLDEDKHRRHRHRGESWGEDRHGSHGHEGCHCDDCQCEKCPDELAIKAATLLLANYCSAFSAQNLALIDGGIIINKSTVHYKNYVPSRSKCVDLGCQNYLEGTVPLIAAGVQCTMLQVTSSYVDSKGRVIVMADGQSNAGGQYIDHKNRFVFTPQDNSCEYKMTHQDCFDVRCV